MSRWLHHGLNELRLSLFRARRYLFETLLGLGLLLLLFAGLLFAVSAVSGRSLDSGALDGLLLGFVLWVFAAGSYGCASGEVADEMQAGTLEGLCVAPLSLGGLLLLRTALRMLFCLIGLLLMTALLQSLVGTRLDSLRALGPALLAAPALVGWGFASAGLLLLVKRAEAVPAIFGLALMALVSLPAYPANGWALLPYALGAAAGKAAASGASLAPSIWAWIAVNSAAWLFVGFAIFLVAERRARQLGILGHR